MIDATGNDWFSNLTTTDGSNLVMNAYKKRQRRYRDAKNPGSPDTPATPAKRRKVAPEPPTPEDLDAAVAALAECTTAKETRKIATETAYVYIFILSYVKL
jgi:hypothetical protein